MKMDPEIVKFDSVLTYPEGGRGSDGLKIKRGLYKIYIFREANQIEGA